MTDRHPRSPVALVTSVLRLHATVVTAARARDLTLAELADAIALHPDGVAALIEELRAAGLDVDALGELIDDGLADLIVAAEDEGDGAEAELEHVASPQADR